MIETSRLRCEPVTAAHADEMYSVLADERIYAYLSERRPASLEDLRRRYEFLSAGKSPDGSEHWLNWILFLRATGEPIGFYQATVRPADCSIAYVLNPAFWGRGYATEASIAIVTHLFERFELPTVTTEINVKNQTSIALVKRLGFTFVRHDAEEDDDVYEVTRCAWDHLHADAE